MTEPTAVLHVAVSLSDIDRADWDACANPGWELGPDGPRRTDHYHAHASLEGTPYNPFISHDFLMCLEESGSATARTGWAPRHLILKDEIDRPIGLVPCYVKSHSQGEYVFDHGWANAF